MKVKFFKEHKRPPVCREEYAYDTRYFALKQTKRPIEPYQALVDKIVAAGRPIANTLELCKPTGACSPLNSNVLPSFYKQLTH